METPNMRVHDLNMEMGLKFKHTMFDPDKVDIMSLLKLIPPAWEEMMKLLPGNENEKGMVTLLTEALETQPLKDLPNPLDLNWVEEAKGWSLKSQLNDVLKLLLPKKKKFEFDVGKKISIGMDRYKFKLADKKLVMKDPEKCTVQPQGYTGDDPQCILIFPNMFKPHQLNDANGEIKRRRDGGQGEQGELGDQGRCGKDSNKGSRRLHRRRLHPIGANIVEIPADIQLTATPHKTARRLDGVSIPSDVFTKKGGSCSLTIGDDFPKTITCNVEILVRPQKIFPNITIPEITANVRAQLELAYSLDGKTLALIVRAGVNVHIPPIAELEELPEALRDTLATLDVGALIGRGKFCRKNDLAINDFLFYFI